jgi:hypothetical protein
MVKLIRFNDVIDALNNNPSVVGGIEDMREFVFDSDLISDDIGNDEVKMWMVDDFNGVNSSVDYRGFHSPYFVDDSIDPNIITPDMQYRKHTKW